jgi:hypothetical protein
MGRELAMSLLANEFLALGFKQPQRELRVDQ